MKKSVRSIAYRKTDYRLSKEPQTDYAIQLFISGKMSCIDAAIIKALVEHIGMNPEDVVGGGGSSMIQAEWSNNSDEIRVQLPEGTKIDIGTGIILSLAEGGPFGLYCMSIDKDTSGTKTQYTFKSGQDSATIKMINEGAYYTLDIPFEALTGLPDNQSTGIFNLTGIAQIAEVLKQIIMRLHKTIDGINTGA